MSVSMAFYMCVHIVLEFTSLIGSYFLQDLLANPKCSLLVPKDPEDRTDLVITVHGDAVSVSCSPYNSMLSFEI